MITITVNGKPRQVERSISISDLLRVLDITHEHVAVARNGEVVPRDRWVEVTVQEGDQVEVVRMVGGGAPGAG